jgi:DNA-binding response OmpR family regulator
VDHRRYFRIRRMILRRARPGPFLVLIRLGAFDYLTKPGNGQDLQEKVTQACARKTAGVN